jgi:hypothetical protein
MAPQPDAKGERSIWEDMTRNLPNYFSISHLLMAISCDFHQENHEPWDFDDVPIQMPIHRGYPIAIQ